MADQKGGQIFKQPVDLFTPKVYTSEEQMLMAREATEKAFGKVYDMFLDKKPSMNQETFKKDCYAEFASKWNSYKFTEKQVDLFREIAMSKFTFLLSISQKEAIENAARTAWGIQKNPSTGIASLQRTVPKRDPQGLAYASPPKARVISDEEKKKSMGEGKNYNIEALRRDINNLENRIKSGSSKKNAGSQLATATNRLNTAQEAKAAAEKAGLAAEKTESPAEKARLAAEKARQEDVWRAKYREAATYINEARKLIGGV
ncbi:MAG: hypothetical protein PHS02_00080 [Candidatus ainarchaeum sp.]|nr:hypothetical protein [Candidatus ainarchaeum sp.]